MAIARAGPADAERVLDFYSSTIDGMRDHPYRPRRIRDACPSCEGIARHCTNGGQHLLEGQGILAAVVIRHAGEEPDGSVKWQVDAKGDEVSTIHLLAVRPGLQSRGLATHLLGFAERLCRGRGDLAIRLAALPDGVPSSHLCARCGYRLICTKSYHFDIAGDIGFHLYERPLAEQQSRIPDGWRTLAYHAMASARGWNLLRRALVGRGIELRVPMPIVSGITSVLIMLGNLMFLYSWVWASCMAMTPTAASARPPWPAWSSR